TATATSTATRRPTSTPAATLKPAPTLQPTATPPVSATENSALPPLLLIGGLGIIAAGFALYIIPRTTRRP
ncbi:MAG TPA: hypothetical protein VLG46_05955, partial [Anaerolineae bacterium]|nr:hypothetical protein [Anaerolineae bacterium]